MMKVLFFKKGDADEKSLVFKNKKFIAFLCDVVQIYELDNKEKMLVKYMWVTENFFWISSYNLLLCLVAFIH